jgi:hypothetical protein
MPRDPIDISVSSPERSARKLGEFDDAKDPIRLRVGSGPAGAEGPEGKEGKEGPAGGEIPIARGETTVKIKSGATESEEKTIEHGLGAKPTFVGLSIERAKGSGTFGFRIISRTTTKFTFMLNQTPAAGEEATYTILWEAC